VSLLASKNRLLSLDVFRGFTIASMVLVNNPGDWAHVYAPLKHAEWNGWTFTDWIFPFFLFICGVSLVLSTAAVRDPAAHSDAKKRSDALLHVWRRSLIVIVIGLGLNFIPSFSFETLRFPGVLQRIGLCMLVAAPLVLFVRVRSQAAWAIALMAIYALIQLLLPVPDVNGAVIAGALEPGRDVGAYIDRALMSGHLWAKVKTWDPEGLLTTMPAISTVLFGALTGHWLERRDYTPAAKTVWMFLAGLVALLAGVVLDVVLMPINKSLWTPSYAVFMSGWVLLLFSASYWLIDACDSPHLKKRAVELCTPFAMYGVNALFIFVLSGLVARGLGMVKWQVLVQGVEKTMSLKDWLVAHISSLPIAPINASLLYAVLFNLVMFSVAALLWRRRIIIKL
jgi:predicted acyltransferase